MSAPDPAIAYMTVGRYSWGCGYDWNGAGVTLEGARRLSREWVRGREAAILFRFDPVSQECVDQAQAVVREAGFVRIWVISTPKPRAGGPPLLPSAI